MVTIIIVISLFSYGWCAMFWDGQIFDKVGDWLEDRLPEYITKPLFLCPICCSFWTGTAIYWWIFEGSDWRVWLLVCVCSIGLNAIVVNLINKIEDISKLPAEDEEMKTEILEKLNEAITKTKSII